MKKAPLILISPGSQRRGAEFFDFSVNLSEAYPGAIAQSGGIPWILPCRPDRVLIAESVHRAGGVLLTGGDDVAPEIYSAPLTPRLRKTICPADPERDLTELLVIDEVFRQRKPLLAICRGQQILNVAFGGSLIVDIPTQHPGSLNHSRSDLKGSVVHDIQLAEGSRIRKIIGRDAVGVNSTHHQAVDRLAKPFQASGVSPDGIIEAFELAPAEASLLPFLMSVQFHPERLIDRHSEFLLLFRSFIKAASTRS
jgi:putative glutamine amidotransferase